MGDLSKYKDYVQNQPATFDCYATCYTDDERLQLVGCDSMILKTTMRKTMEVNDYKLLEMAYPDISKEITYEEFKRGKILAGTRSYDLVWTDGVVRQVLIPFLEFGAINFGGEPNV
jgi:hypothetical protein